MRLAVFGGAADPITQAQVEAILGFGDEAILIDYAALEYRVPVSSLDGRYSYAGGPVGELDGAILRFIPQPSAPYVERDGELVLYSDWHALFMQSTERASVYMSWLLELEHAGIPLVNPPHAGSVHQFKPFQLQVLRGIGARVPRTLISNDPAAVRAFADEVGEVIYKPVMGGALTRRLDAEARERLELIAASPVIFQELAPGEDIRVTLVGDRVVSAVAIQSPEGTLDFRGDPTYAAQGGTYREVELPPHVVAHCRQAMRTCRLEFAGVDLRHQGDDWIFLELNSSPVYLDVERKTGHPITRALVEHLRGLALARKRAA